MSQGRKMELRWSLARWLSSLLASMLCTTVSTWAAGGVRLGPAPGPLAAVIAGSPAPSCSLVAPPGRAAGPLEAWYWVASYGLRQAPAGAPTMEICRKGCVLLLAAHCLASSGRYSLTLHRVSECSVARSPGPASVSLDPLVRLTARHSPGPREVSSPTHAPPESSHRHWQAPLCSGKSAVMIALSSSGGRIAKS